MPEGEVAVGLVIVKLVEETPEESIKVNKGRGSLRFQTPVANTGNVYIQHSKQVAIAGVNMGIEMIPGTMVSMNKHDDFDIDFSWYAIADLAGQIVIVNLVDRS